MKHFHLFVIFFQSLEKKDIVIGIVTSILDGGMIITLLCLDNTKARDIDHLKITVSYLNL